jgi:predicted nucleic acid-binding protein
MTLVVDACAAVEYLLRSQLGERIGRILNGARIAAPELLDAEALAVLRREALRGALSPRRAAEAIEDLAAWNLERLEHRGLLADAWKLRNNLSAYDALYVSAARVLNATVVTADGPLSRAPGLGVPVHNVRLS